MCELCSNDAKLVETGKADLRTHARKFREFADHLEMLASGTIRPHHGNKSIASLVTSLVRYLAIDWL